MANKKITQLTDIGSGVSGVDLLHIIDDPAGSPVNKKISIDSLFENIPGLLNVSQTPETITSSGTVSVGHVTNLISTGSSNIALTLGDGNNGQIKFITMTVDGGGNATVTPVNLLGGSIITFNDIGDSVMLLFTGTTWAIMSNNGVVVS